MQFSSRFKFRVAKETVRLCKNLELGNLPKERIFEEFKKMLLLSDMPSIGFETARMLNILEIFPELNLLVDIPQDPLWHPEGNVWTHTMRVLNAAALLKNGTDEKNLELMLAALCHDFGKSLTTNYMQKRWRSHSHDIKEFSQKNF